MQFTVTSGSYLAELKRRAAQDHSGVPITARIVVSDDMEWWYYQEFGTPSFYRILPNTAKLLSFPWHGEQHFTEEVEHHPPIRARHMVASVLGEIEAEVRNSVVETLLNTDFDVESVRAELFATIMPRVKEIIRLSFEQNLPGTREDGRLGGFSAADTFESEATIE